MTSWWTCADFKICGRWAFPWSSTRLTPFNCRAAPGIAPQASGSTSPRSPGRRSPSGSTRSSWRCTRIPTGRSRTGGRCPTGRTCCASAICRGSWTRSPRSRRRSRQPRGRPWNEERHEKRSRIAPRLRPPMTRPDLRRLAERVLRLEAEAILGLIPKLDESFDRAVELLRRCAGRVVVTGMGKSGLVGRKIAATLASTGTPAYFLHPAEGVHGDIGMVARGDVVLALSNSGETDEVLAILPPLKRLGVPIVLLTGNPTSPLARQCEVVLDVSVPEEACPMNLTPTSSTTAALAAGDALAMVLLAQRGRSRDARAEDDPCRRSRRQGARSDGNVGDHEPRDH